MAGDRISVLVKFPAPLLAEIDAACASSRTAWIVEACEDRLKGSAHTAKIVADLNGQIDEGLERMRKRAGVSVDDALAAHPARMVGGSAYVVGENQRRVEPTDPVVLAAMQSVPFGPSRPKPGAMLIDKQYPRKAK